MARRRRFSRSYAGRRNGRQYFWFRFEPFGVTVRQSTSGTHSDIFLTEDDVEGSDPEANMTQRGGVRVERIVADYGVAVDALAAWFQPAGDGNIAQIPQWYIWKQNQSITTMVTSSATFTSVLSDTRILMCEVPNQEIMTQLGTSGRAIRVTRGRVDIKAKCRLADSALGVAWRGYFDESSANLAGFTDWFRPSILVSK